MKTAVVLDGPDELLRHAAHTEVDAIRVVRALLEVLCDIQILAMGALAAVSRRIGGWFDS